MDIAHSEHLLIHLQLMKDQGLEPLTIFLCHGKEDKPKVRDLHARLLRDGFRPWLDEEDLLPGQDWRLEIEKAVRAADVVVVCLSASSASRRGFAQKEIQLALDVADEQPEGELYVIPLRLEEFELPERLRRWQWVNFFDEDGYEKLIRALSLKKGRHPAPPVSPDDRESQTNGLPDAASPRPRKARSGLSWMLPGIGAILLLAAVLWAVWAYWRSGSAKLDDRPQITATYDLQATVTTTERGAPEWTAWGPEVRIAKLGHPGDDYDCTDKANRRDVCVPIPPDSVPVYEKNGIPRVEVEPASEWGSWCDGQRSDAVAHVVGNQVCKPYWNWRASVTHFKRIRLLFQKLTKRRISKDLMLDDLEGRPAKRLLPGQVYATDLQDVFPSFSDPIFELVVRRSDGLELLANAKSQDPKRLFASYDPSSKKYRVRLEPDG